MADVVFDAERAGQLSTLWTKHLKGIGAGGVVSVVVGAIGLTGLGGAAWGYLRINDLQSMVSTGKTELDTKLQSLRVASGGLLLPAGTIVAWPGQLPLNDPVWQMHWHACDGSEVAFTEDLWRSLKGLYGNPEAERVINIKLPNLAGVFLRGLGGKSSALGVEQPFATAQARTPFVTGGDNDGHHQHQFTGFGHKTSKGDGGGVSFNGFFAKWDGGNADQFLGHGGHTHTIVGGDDETRPTNFSVHWIIRIQ